jgi:hypothetical protein
MITKYITYARKCPDENGVTEFEFIWPESKEEYGPMSSELKNVQVSGNMIYYTFRVDIKLKGVNYNMPQTDEESKFITDQVF